MDKSHLQRIRFIYETKFIFDMKCAVYVRVSTKKQKEEGISIEAQLNALNEFIKKRKWKLYKKYVDQGHSGCTLRRPHFRLLLEDALEKKFDVILVYKLDRFSRNLRDIILTLDKLAKYQIGFISITQPVDTTNPMGKAFMRMMGVFAELERDMISERISFSMNEKAKKGYPQHRAPFGYYFKNKNLYIKKDEANKVKQIFQAYLKGRKRYHLAEKYRMSFQTINNILSNPIYYGIIKWKKNKLKGNHKPIILEKLFKKVQRLRSA